MNTLFTTQLIDWQKKFGRHNLPWHVNDPYKIWLSEIMLQQTQVATVCDYFMRFIQRFPTVTELANADEDEVLALWAGLGYYSRARNLHAAARQIMHDFGGKFPQNRVELQTLKGVGRSTAAAIAVFAFCLPETILDGNVKRVLCRVFALDGDLQNKAFEKELWHRAEQLLPSNRNDLSAYIQGLMDLGATVCTRNKPKCEQCPQNNICQARQQNRIDALPRKKTALTVKNMPMFWAIVKNNERILLEKRPAKGIWASLFCVPCFDDENKFNQFIQDNHLILIKKDNPFMHRLTHRKLEIKPYFFRLPENNPKIKNKRFYSLDEIQQMALPKPLMNLFSGSLNE
ncbi:MAG: A/G-specific adenine glycosylase [Neisseriaceae bacterium]|nr:A/G-specific adenine glycosylase [Neisseriaceae bacterium]